MGIEAKEVKFGVMIANTQNAYEVPRYQRPYTWTKDQWEELFEDIIGLEDDEVHFLGSIIVVTQQHRLGVNYFSVVDGQQRIATLLIWLSVIRDITNSNELAKHLEGYLFAKEWESGSNKEILIPKLKPGKLDDDAFQKVLKGDDKKGKHLIFDCYEYFKEKTRDVNLWEKLLNNISVVHIRASDNFNAFKLFETLNDRGLELSAADLIKNFLLMKVSDNSDDEKIDDTIDEWNEMYEKVRDYEPVKFIRRYILSNWEGKISETKLYKQVESKLKDKEVIEILEFVKSLNSSATVYKKVLECSLSSDRLNKKLRELHLVEVAPAFTLLLKIIPYMENKGISEDAVLEIMETIETFHIRWGICGLATGRLDQIYNEICMKLKNVTSKDFKDVIKQELSQKMKNNADDELFKNNFLSRSFKATEPRTKYILWKLSEPTGETSLNIQEIQTEHIMPQKLSDDWINYLMKEASETSQERIFAWHKEILDRIGNLTIIKGNWNARMSNKLFDEKKEEYARSEFQITKKLCDYQKWTFDNIEERAEEFAKKALEIWYIPC